MLATPMSSPQMMRMLGFLPDEAAGAVFCACASAPEVNVAAATRWMCRAVCCGGLERCHRGVLRFLVV
jgi:hypothetical protein